MQVRFTSDNSMTLTSTDQAGDYRPASYPQPDLPLLYQGKVRDVYAVDDNHLLMLASDRLSAFDVILPDAIPEKGEILTGLSNFWFQHTAHLQHNHMTVIALSDILPPAQAQALRRRAVIVKRLQPLPVEAIVRGYLIGSGWKDYQASGKLCGIELPADLRLADKLAAPLFTPSSKAQQGEHDENISYADLEDMIGVELAAQMRAASLSLYQHAFAHAWERGIIIADCKFEFGLDEQQQLVLMDEIFTPDAARFWPRDAWQPGQNPPSYDKQFVRDYLETLDWNKQPPAPRLPAEVIAATVARYQTAYHLLTGQPWQQQNE